MKKTAREVHGLAEQSRESGDFLNALQLIEQAIILYSQENDTLGLAEVMGSKFLTLRHLYEQTGDFNFLILAKHCALASTEISAKSGNLQALALPFFNLAKAYETLGERQNAIDSYTKAIQAQENNPHKLHDRPAVLYDMKIHKLVCEYIQGNKDVLPEIMQTISLLENDKSEPKYNHDVWLSGAYMKLSEAFKNDDQKKAKEFLDKAKNVIDSNKELVLRAKQWEKLKASFE